MPKTKNAFAYIRVSTRQQGENGNGLDLQMARIKAYAKAAGLTIVDTFRDVQTGVGEESIRKRPGIVAAAKKSQELGIPILVDGLDRVSRNRKKLDELID